MRDDLPELYVPARERRQPANWRLVLLRIWCVLGCIAAWMVLTAGERELYWRPAVYTLAIFYIVWRIVAWIFRPALPSEDDRR